MKYQMKDMTVDVWERISSKIPAALRKQAIGQGWPEVALSNGIAVAEPEDSWLCRAPNITGARPSRWLMFHLDGETYCLRIVGVVNPTLEFDLLAPSPEKYDDFKESFLEAFAVHGLYGMGEPNHFSPPTFPVV